MSDKDNNNTSLVPFNNHVADMSVGIPDNPKGSYKATCTQIKNAWVNFTHIDDEGVIWVDIERIHSILRTNKVIAKYKLKDIEDKDILRYGKKVYVKAYQIRNLIDSAIQIEKIGKKKEYLRYSEQIYMAIRDCDTAEIIREKYNSLMESERRKLKNKRIREYKIKNDELTGDRLEKETAEFSHIRSYAIFREVATNIENGLIVNKETHSIITKRGINDEIELYDLCIEKNWSTDWYLKYKNYFNLN